MNYHETNLNWILNWINFGQNLNIELNQFRYRTGLPLSPRPAMPIPQTHTWLPRPLLHHLSAFTTLFQTAYDLPPHFQKIIYYIIYYIIADIIADIIAENHILYYSRFFGNTSTSAHFGSNMSPIYEICNIIFGIRPLG